MEIEENAPMDNPVPECPSPTSLAMSMADLSPCLICSETEASTEESSTTSLFDRIIIAASEEEKESPEKESEFLKIISADTPIAPTSVELFEQICRYFRIDGLTGSENISGFCSNCLKLISELLKLHRIKVAIQKDISQRIKQIEDILGTFDKPLEKEISSNGEFGRKFRRKVRISLLPRVKVKLEKLPESRTAKMRSFQESQSRIKTNLSETIEDTEEYPLLNLSYLEVEDIKIKVQPEDYSEFEDESAEPLPFLINPDIDKTEEDAESPIRQQEYFDDNDDYDDDERDEVCENSPSPPPLPIARSLRPRRNAKRKSYREEDLLQDFDEELDDIEIRPDSEQVRVKNPQELLSNDEDEDGDQMSDGENDPEIVFSDNSEQEEEESDPDVSESIEEDDDDDWAESKPTRNRRPSRRTTSSRSRSSRNSRRRRRRSTSTKAPRRSNDGDDVVITANGKILYREIEITKSENPDGGMRYTCGACGSFSNIGKMTLLTQRASEFYRIKLHIRGAHFAEYTCEICSKSLLSQRSLTRHRLTHAYTPETPVSRCSICEKPFKSHKTVFLKIHEWTHKSEEEKEAAIASGQKAPLTYKEKVELARKKNPECFPCSQCNKTFYWKSLLRKHENRMHVPDHEKVKNYNCQKCQKKFACQGDLTAHKKMVCEREKQARVYFCSHCSKKFYSKDDCAQHERKHTKEKPFQCTKCLKYYRGPKSLRQHICIGKPAETSGRVMFEGLEFFHDDTETGFTLRCGSCDFIVEHPKSKQQPRCDGYRKMHVHIRGRHLGKYKCTICDKQLSDPKGLANHIASHSTETKYSCDICGKPFKTKQSGTFYKNHAWTHLNEAERQERIEKGQTAPLSYAEKQAQINQAKGDNLLQCHQCGKTFHWQCQLRKHERSHIGKESRVNHQCPICGKFYATADGLLSHTKHVHDKDKISTWHYCSYCPKKFSHKFAWRRHERAHTRDRLKPFQCDKCSRSFSQEKNFHNHVTQCTGQSSSNKPTASGGSKRKRRPQTQAQDDSNSSTSNNAPSHSHTMVSSGGEELSAGGAMPMPLLGHGHHNPSFANNPLMIHQLNQFRQLQQQQGSNFNANASAAGTSSNRFYEDGNIYQNFY